MNYYPFGLTFQQPLGSDLPNRYLFNGKELTNDFGLGMYDYGARQYDPAIGRWTSIDPMASKYGAHSAYSYVFNNPIIFIDPDGEDPIDFLSGFFNSVASNHHPTQAGRGYGQPLSGPARNDYNAGQRAGDYVSLAVGAAEVIGGALTALAGGATEVGSLGTTSVVSLPAIAAGVAVTAEGATVISNAQNSLSVTDENGRVNASSNQGENQGRSKNKLEADPEATGDHTVFKRDENGDVFKYETFEKTRTGHDNPTKRFDGGKPDGAPGAPHVNKNTREGVPTPHVQGKDVSGGVRPPRTDELPRNSRFWPNN